MKNKNCEIPRIIRPIYWQEFHDFVRWSWTITVSFLFLVRRSLNPLKSKSLFLAVFSTVALITGRNMQGWLRKQTFVRIWASEGWHSGKSASPYFKPVFSERTVCTAKEDLPGLNPVWNFVLWKVLYAFSLGWRFFLAYKNQAYIPLSYEMWGQKQTGIFTFWWTSICLAITIARYWHIAHS